MADTPYMTRWCQDCNSQLTVASDSTKTQWRHDDKQLCISKIQARNQELAELYGRLAMKNSLLQQRAHLSESRAKKAEAFMRRLAPLTRYVDDTGVAL